MQLLVESFLLIMNVRVCVGVGVGVGWGCDVVGNAISAVSITTIQTDRLLYDQEISPFFLLFGESDR